MAWFLERLFGVPPRRVTPEMDAVAIAGAREKLEQYSDDLAAKRRRFAADADLAWTQGMRQLALRRRAYVREIDGRMVLLEEKKLNIERALDAYFAAEMDATMLDAEQRIVAQLRAHAQTVTPAMVEQVQAQLSVAMEDVDDISEQLAEPLGSALVYNEADLERELLDERAAAPAPLTREAAPSREARSAGAGEEATAVAGAAARPLPATDKQKKPVALLT
jgi:hypothetical protein